MLHVCLIEILQAVACISVSCKVQWNQDRPLCPHGNMPERNITNPWPITIVHSSRKKLVDNMDFKHRFNLFQIEVKLGSRSKSQDTSSHWTFCDSILASAFHSCLPPSMFGHFLYPNSKRPIPSQKWILKQQVRVPLNILKQSENYLPMYEPLASPRQSHSQNNTKTLPGPRPPFLARSTAAPAEISCSTTAAWPFAAAKCSGVSPRAPRMRRRRRGSCGCRRETKRSKWDVSPGGWAKFADRT